MSRLLPFFIIKKIANLSCSSDLYYDMFPADEDVENCHKQRHVAFVPSTKEGDYTLIYAI